MAIQSYYQPQENGEYMYIEVDNSHPGSKPIVGPEYYDTFVEVQRRYTQSKNTIPLEIVPYTQRLS